MKNIILIIAVLMISFTSLFSQDIIELKSGEKMEVKITKIGLEEIEFRPYKSTDEAVIKLDKFLVKAYKFENSDSEIGIYAEKLTNLDVKDLYSNKKFYAFKTQPIQLLTGKYKLSFEQSLSYNSSYEVELGINHTVDYFDLFDETYTTFNTSLRYKMFYRPTSVKMTDIGRNPLHGLYFAPVLSAGTSRSLNYQYDLGGASDKYNVYGAAMIDLGYQFVFNAVIVDSFVGIGASINSDNTDLSMNTSHTSFGHAAIRAGFRVGINKSY